jgi:hypothetical protein
LLGVAAPVAAEEAAASPAVATASGDYFDCMRATATRLEPSGERADFIATAAKRLCVAGRAQAEAEAERYLHDPTTAQDSVEASATDTAVAAVVTARLCRLTRDCDLTVPKAPAGEAGRLIRAAYPPAGAGAD